MRRTTAAITTIPAATTMVSASEAVRVVMAAETEGAEETAADKTMEARA
jgi:hypothetical protein